MKAAREARKAKEVDESKQEASVANETVDALLRRIEQLEKERFFTPPVQQAVQAITKYSTLPQDWPNPCERLANEPALQEHAFKQNFTLKWEVGKVNYKKDGVNYTEPKFRIELWRWMRDPETQQLTTKQYRVHRATFFEDPDAAVQVASEKGIEIDDQFRKAFLDEMRYLRIRDWLMEIFYPQPAARPESVREEVVGNRLVRVLETSGYEPQVIAHDKLKI